ncbi:tetratricopeptide repeat protein [Candidatus Latescibacterota bacterium]
MSGSASVRPHVLAVAAGVAVFFCHVLWSESSFQYDDIHSIANNPHIRQLGNVPQFFVRSDMFSEHSWGRMYRPLVLSTYAVNHAIGGLDPAGYGWMNCLLHGTASGLVVAALALLGTTAPWAAVGGLAFGLLPVNVEVAHYISSRSESLSAVFLLISLIAYVRYAVDEYRPGTRLAVSLAAFCAALLAKESAVILPLLLLGYEVFAADGDGSSRERVRRCLPRQAGHWVLAAAYVALMRHHVLRATLEDPARGLVAQVATQVKAWVYYLGLLWMPTHLSVEHRFRISSDLAEPPVLLAGLMLICVLSLALAVGQRPRPWLFWLWWAGAALLPTSVVPLNVLVNEHRLYLPSVAFVALTVSLFRGLGCRRPTASAIGVVVALLFYGVLSAQRSAVWADAGALWGDALAKGPRMPRPHLFMGDHYDRIGDQAAALSQYDSALSVYPQALSPGDRLAIHNNRGAALLALGRFPEAVEAYQAALRYDPTYTKARDALEGLLAVGGAERAPEAARLHKQGMALMIQGRVGEAARRFEGSLAMQSWPETWLSLGMAYERMEEWEQARVAYRSLRIAGAGTAFEETAIRRLSLLGERP